MSSASWFFFFRSFSLGEPGIFEVYRDTALGFVAGKFWKVTQFEKRESSEDSICRYFNFSKFREEVVISIRSVNIEKEEVDNNNWLDIFLKD